MSSPTAISQVGMSYVGCHAQPPKMGHSLLHYPYVSILLIYTPKDWKLLLSKTIWVACIWKLIRSGYRDEQALVLSTNILRRHGIRGLRAEDAGFDFWDKERREW